MDNHFNNILQTFKKLNEGSTKDYYWSLAERMDREQFIEYTTTELGQDPNEMSDFWDSINGDLDESTRFSFAGEPEQKAGDQVRGTDVAQPNGTKHPFNGRLVGECDAPMTLTDKLRARWEETKRAKGLQEYGMTTGGTTAPGTGPTPGINQNDPKAQAEKQQTTTNALNQLKSAGLTIPNMSQAVKTTLKTDDPKAQLNQQDKNVDMGFGQTLGKILTTAQPNDIGQLKNIIKKISQDQ
jgi:hypothetical protein